MSPAGIRRSTVDCSVLIPVLDEERYIEQTLAAVRAQRFEGRLEFIFADGGSADRTTEILRRHARDDTRIRIYENPRRTVSSGLNVALSHAQGRWVARMDAHTEYRDDYLTLGVERLNAGGTRWVSGPPLPIGHKPVSRAVSLALGTSLGQGGSRKWTQEGAGDTAEFELDSGVFGGVWERRTLLEFGGWDEGWTCNEDAEMAGRFLRRGERLICLPAMAARYMPRDSLRGLWRQYRAYGEFRVKTARRHPDTMRRVQLVAPALVLDALIAVIGPGVTRPIARTGVGAYAALILAEGFRARRRATSSLDTALVPAALATMHFAWGTGSLLGALRFGPPLAGITHALGLAASPHPMPDLVYAPSLTLT
jgi:succinoglycan biosynthesis protein ExoA